jgi:hypothetical protein
MTEDAPRNALIPLTLARISLCQANLAGYRTALLMHERFPDFVFISLVSNARGYVNERDNLRCTVHWRGILPELRMPNRLL